MTTVALYLETAGTLELGAAGGILKVVVAGGVLAAGSRIRRLVAAGRDWDYSRGALASLRTYCRIRRR